MAGVGPLWPGAALYLSPRKQLVPTRGRALAEHTQSGEEPKPTARARCPRAVGNGRCGRGCRYLRCPAYGVPVRCARSALGDFYSTTASAYGTVTAGALALGAAGIAYRNGHQQRLSDRRTAEEDLVHAQQQLASAENTSNLQRDADIVRDLRARFTTAAEQLAHDTTTIQTAGAYALASLADDWLTRDNSQEAQVCVNVLCTYLRTHHLTRTAPGAEYDYTQEPFDQPVRDTITRIITSHLHPIATPSWSHLNYDSTGTHLHDASFIDAVFSGDQVSFKKATFSGDRVSFDSAGFSGEKVSFDEAMFSGGVVEFSKVTFSARLARFEATFSGLRANFRGAVFSGEQVSFERAAFSGGGVSFNGAVFSYRLCQVAAETPCAPTVLPDTGMKPLGRAIARGRFVFI